MKYLFHWLLCLVVFYLFPLKSYCQADLLQSESGSSLRLAAGIDLTKLSDTEFSSMLFTGLIPSFNIQMNVGKNIHHQVNLGYAGGKINADKATENSADYVSFSSDYFISKSARYVREKRWYSEPGAGINFIYSERRYEDFINQFKSNEFIGSLSVYYKLLYVLSENKGWTISDQIFIPAFSVISQPEVWQEAGGEPNGTADRSMKAKVYLLPDYIRANNMLTLSRNIHFKHSFHFSYTWDYYQIEDVYRKERVYHSLQLSYQLKF